MLFLTTVCLTLGFAFGSLGIAWVILWMLVAGDSPAQQKWISAEEKDYIDHALALDRGAGVAPPTPWRHVLASPRVHAICATHFATSWCYYTLLTAAPSYIRDVLELDIAVNGLVSAMPFLLQWGLMLVAGPLADRLRMVG
jgi:ACS family sodium-dependent inorganic phosphate cotransporter